MSPLRRAVKLNLADVTSLQTDSQPQDCSFMDCAFNPDCFLTLLVLHSRAKLMIYCQRPYS
ncbi:hypothetical protein PILCRDRAFT_824310 [Piloderma croceum F 1598]|uniref:Uncharacterized protein n=1 Tax=Piloderma croceum (strain F 1598) TaxID=765440 RepID=A0A0C3F0W7_PILCF|nr:hypothetical protein PILCRDRAFT_824310 [Piloderma croceum F 1598]